MPSFLSPSAALTMRSKSETNLVDSLPSPQAHTTSSSSSTSPFLLPPSPSTHHALSTPPSPPKARRRGRSLRKTALLKPPSATHLSAPLLQPPPIPRKTSNSSKSTSTRSHSQEPNYLSDSSVTSTSWQTSLNHAPLYARKDVSDSSADTIFYGWVVLVSTWVAFVIGIGSVSGVWDWAWDVSDLSVNRTQGTCAQWVNQTWGVNVSCDAASVTDPGIFGWEQEGGLPIDGYYPALIVLTGIMAWVWVVIAWVGLKYFKHAKIQTPVTAGND